MEAAANGAGGELAKRIIAYGFPEKGDFDAFKPDNANMTPDQAAQYAGSLKERLGANPPPIPKQRWIRRDGNYVVKVKSAPADDTTIAEEEGCRPDMVGRYGVVWKCSKQAGVYFTKSEITVRQFMECVNDRKCSKDNWKSLKENPKCNQGASIKSDHPMNCVNWYGAKEFCSWIGGRLPTDEEWFNEASNLNEWDWPWGDAPEVNCSYAIWGDGPNKNGCGNDGTGPVCTLEQGNSVSGVCDMTGNVWEWTSTDHKGLKNKVVRGGSWDIEKAEDLLLSHQSRFGPNFRSPHIGIRCVRDW